MGGNKWQSNVVERIIIAKVEMGKTLRKFMKKKRKNYRD